MSTIKHTPGPWEYGVRKNGTIWLSIGNPVAGRHYQGDLCACEADARLIVAAPDLLAELKRMVDHFGTWANDRSMEATTETWSALHCARAAIDWAEGQPS